MSVTNTNKQTIVCMKNNIYIYIHTPFNEQHIDTTCPQVGLF